MNRAIVLLTGTSILLASASAQAQPVTFNKDVAPILYAKCASCHRPGAIGPFSLLSYADARQRATQIANVTSRRVMPPWQPRAPRAAFAGDRSLDEAEIRTIQQWVANGAVEGDPADLPMAPQWHEDWQLGAPDLIVAMPVAFELRADGPDVFRTFVLPLPVTRARYVRGIEFRPGNPRAVHHANIGIDRTTSSRRLDERDAEPGYVGGMVPEAGYPPGHMLGWTPGQHPRASPDGMAWRLEPASDLVVQLHMQPTGKPERVQVSAGFFFTDHPPVREPVGLRLGSQTIDIPAGEREYVVADSYVLPVDAEALAIQPHAHNLARRMDAHATLPDGTTRPLIEIADWDFRWQDVYRYREPVALPEGTRLSMRFVYDNSAANPRNPHNPPQRVVWGQNTSDEMGDLWIQLVPRSPSDLAALDHDVARKRRAEDIAAYAKLADQDPENPLRHDAIAMLYLAEGRADRAAAHLSTSVRLNDRSAPAHYNLGLALSMQRRFDEARMQFESAVRLDPEHAEAHNNLGAMLHIAGRLDEAVEHYSRAVALRPENAEAHSNLGRIRASQRKRAEAVGHYLQALAVNAGLASALSGLAWLRATAPEPQLRDPEAALRLARRAAELTARKEPVALDALAAAHAAAGEFGQAVAAARAAVAAAGPAQAAFAEEIRQRLGLYEQGIAYREP
jgi:Flp pilus assembly protein TadD